MAFVHLHVHTEYSLLDGECRISELPSAVKSLGQNSVAITDHGVMFGVVDFYKECKKQGIKPIIGCEVYIAPRTMDDKVYPIDSPLYHMVLLVKDSEGYKNLSKIVTQSYTRGFYRKPRTDMASLKKYGKGLIALTGCMSGILSKRIASDQISEAKEVAHELKSIFGDDLYIELQRNGVDGQIKVNSLLISIANEFKIPLVATNDVHYIKKEDSDTQELLMAMSVGEVVGKGGDFALPTKEFYLKSTEDMEKLFADIPSSIENTVKIAEKCNFEFDFNTFHLPKYPISTGETSYVMLSRLAHDGLKKRLSDESNIKNYTERLEYELSVIHSMGFDDYFLVVWDFVNFAKRKNIPVGPGRGSAVGSLTAYVLEITDVDPIKYDLLFERFLNPERLSMPDIDIDFCDERRGEVIEYVASKYGEDHMAQIITFGTLQARAAVRDCGRALGMEYSDVDRIAKMIPRSFSGITLDGAMRLNPDLYKAYESDPEVKKLIDHAKKLEGRPRNASTHATGVVITDSPITDYLPLATNDDIAVTQFGMNTAADLGLLKMDFLGLRFLTIIRDTENFVKETQPDFDIEKINFDDSLTYKLLSEGRSLGLFQLESEGMRALLQKLCPENLEDIISVISIYRPGPAQFIDEFLKNRRDKANIKYKTPLLKPILDSSMGCMLYQEQVMQVCRSLAGYSFGRADLVRRAMAKKKKDVMLAEKETFLNGCIANGVEKSVAEEIFDSMESFASYAFNKSHAAAYAVLSYRTAYLKAHFPTQYMCSLLNSVIGDNEKINDYIAECRSLGITVLPPDVNKSGNGFTFSGNEIYFGLNAIKNIGGNFALAIQSDRYERGKFLSFEDFLTRVGAMSNSKMLEALILSGALDSFGIYRSRLCGVIDRAMWSISTMKDELKSGQISLFETSTKQYSPFELDYPPIEEYPLIRKLSLEKEYTGVYFSGHPLDRYNLFAKSSNSVTIKQLISSLENGTIKEKQPVNLLGIIKEIRKKTTKTGKIIGFIVFEDKSTETEITVFSSQLEQYEALLAEGNVVLITGNASLEAPYNGEGDDELKVILRSCEQALADDERDPDIYIKVTNENKHNLEKAISRASLAPGSSRLLIYYSETKKLKASKNNFCLFSSDLISDLKALMGEENVATKA